MWVYRGRGGGGVGGSWCNETVCVVPRAVRYQRVDKKAVPIYHKSHFADDSGNFFFYSPFIKWFSSLDVQKLKSVKTVSKRRKKKSQPAANKAFPRLHRRLAPSPFIPLPQIDCQHILRNFYDIHDAAEKW